MAKMRAMVVRERGGSFVAEERDIPTPGPEEMRIRVQACGVCHSDVVTVQGLFPIVQYPRVPGHEVIGVVDALGEGVHGLEGGRPRGRRLVRRLVRLLPPMPARQCVRLRERARNQRRDARRRLRHPHDRPCVIGRACAGRSRRGRIGAAALCGRHHLQCASSYGRRPRRHRRCPRRRRPGASRESSMRPGRGFAPSRSTAAATRRNWRNKLGASDYIDSAAEDPAKALTAMGGAKAILATVTDGKAMQAISGGLGPNGVMMVIGARRASDRGFVRSSRQARIGQGLVLRRSRGIPRTRWTSPSATPSPR